MYGHCNAGKTYTNPKGKYGSIDLCLNKEGIATILSIPVLKNLGFCITYNRNEDHWCVSKDNINVKFKEDRQGTPFIYVG